MELAGQWDENAEKISVFTLAVSDQTEKYFNNLPEGDTKDAVRFLFSNICAVSVSIVDHCKNPNKRLHSSSFVPAVLLRTLIDCCISIFAFCRGNNDTERSRLFLNFSKVADFKRACLEEKNLGCPYIPNRPEICQTIALRKELARSSLLEFGTAYLKKKCRDAKEAQSCLIEATKRGCESLKEFRDRWYPETRRDILKEREMEWVYDVFYTRLSSAVHADVHASEIFRGAPRSGVGWYALQFWGAAIYALVAHFKIPLTKLPEGDPENFLGSICYKNLCYPAKP